MNETYDDSKLLSHYVEIQIYLFVLSLFGWLLWKCATLSCLSYRLFFLRSIVQFFTEISIKWTNFGNSGKSMDNCWMSRRVMADMKKSLRRSHNYQTVLQSPLRLLINKLYFSITWPICLDSWSGLLFRKKP